MAPKYEHPLSITIPVPYNEPRHQGIYANSTKDSTIIFCRVNKFDNELIQQICKDLDLKPATFFRFCAVRAAQELEKNKNAYLESSKP